MTLLRTSKTLTKDTNQISWKRALDTIDARIGFPSRAASESVQYYWRGYWKGVLRFSSKSSGVRTVPTHFVGLVSGRSDGGLEFPKSAVGCGTRALWALKEDDAVMWVLAGTGYLGKSLCKICVISTLRSMEVYTGFGSRHRP